MTLDAKDCVCTECGYKQKTWNQCERCGSIRVVSQEGLREILIDAECLGPQLEEELVRGYKLSKPIELDSISLSILQKLQDAGLMNNLDLFDQTPDEIISRRAGSTHKLFVACGLGLNSVAGLILLKAWGDVPDAILFADTGGEKNATYKYLPILNDWLASVEFPAVTIVKRDMKHEKQKRNEKYNTLEEECLVKKCLPSIA
ncbi:MAG: hypothetical protein E6R03_15195 [Hyphomicrobiaceae bacterium]|nr:MAG: hypothetical protein E6R03_15195 [Hyphomicrobiaceae bacterium]